MSKNKDDDKREVPNAQEYLKREKEKVIPLNNLDSAWRSASPDYTELQNKIPDQKYTEVFDLVNSALRLANLSKAKAKVIEYDLITAGWSYDLKYKNVSLSVLFDTTAIVEVSHGVAGFRTNAMNTIIQQVSQTNIEEKKSVFGGGKKNE